MIKFEKPVQEEVKKSFENQETILMQPGKHLVTVKSLKYKKEEGKTPYLLVVFEKEDKSVLFERFWLTEKTVARLNELHKVAFGRDLVAEFETFDDVAAYFISSFEHEPVKMGITVGGEIVNGKLIPKMPFRYYCSKAVGFQEEIFKEGTPKYDALVKVVSYDRPVVTEVKEPVAVVKEVLIPEVKEDDLPF